MTLCQSLMQLPIYHTLAKFNNVNIAKFNFLSFNILKVTSNSGKVMKIFFVLIFAALVTPTKLSAQNSHRKDFAGFVNPMVGTDFHGHTFPGATYPFGMMQLSPDTRLSGWDGCSGYHYSDTIIYGFSHTHLSGTGASDYGDILIIPVSNYPLTLGINNSEYSSAFSHSTEKATPGYYEVFLKKWGVNTKLTIGKRAGLHYYTYTKTGAQPAVIIDLTHRDDVIDSKIEVVGNNIVKGYRRSRMWAKDQIVYFYIEFSQTGKGVLYKDDYPAGMVNTISGKNCKLYFEFFPNSNKENEENIKRKKIGIMAKIGISSVSQENAKMNMLSEIPAWDFDALLKSTQRAWNEYLGKIDVSFDKQSAQMGINQNNAKKREHQIRTFYSTLYHSAIHPNLYSDVNGEYRGMDRQIHKAVGYEQYTVFSLWDTYRALHPLFTIIEQKRTSDFINSFLAIYREAGKLPIWELSGNETDCMIAYHSVSVIADAAIKGIGGFDKNAALEAMIASSNKKEYGKEFYLQYGYLPAEKEHESVSKTLEYSYDDWCIAQYAKQMNKADIYSEYINRGQYYKNIFDPSTGFMRPKHNGVWLSPFNPTEVNNHFTEANSWQYSFYVPQDVNTHISMLGGDSAYTEKLDEMFNAAEQTTGRTQVDITGLIGQYAHGNEPSHHAAYLFNYAGMPWKSQKIIRQIASTLYSAEPDGICGNDDCGQTSAWYVFSAMGFYPVTPGNTTYVTGSPMFDKIVIKLESGKHFTLLAPGSFEKPYVEGIKIDGKNYTKSYFEHSDIINGKTFEFTMGATPNPAFGANPADRPHSQITENTIVVNPWFEMDNNIFKDSMVVIINSADSFRSVEKSENKKEANKIFFRQFTIGQKPGQFIEYTKPLIIKESCKLEAYTQQPDGKVSYVVESFVNKIAKNWKVAIINKYNRQYSAGGDEGLIDGVRGAANFRLGGWQGYQDTDFEAIVDIGSLKNLSSIGAGFLQDARSWIWMPKYVEYSVSADGINYKTVGKIVNSVAEDDETAQIQTMILKSDKFATTANGVRYIKVFAKNLGRIPAWHPGAGDEAFIFIDEIVLDY